jgi:hypothetical protein
MSAAQVMKITGTVISQSDKKEVPFTNIKVTDSIGNFWDTNSDLQGKFTIEVNHEGSYSLKASFVGYQTLEKKGITVVKGKTTKVEIILKEEPQMLQTFEVVSNSVPLISRDATTSAHHVSGISVSKGNSKAGKGNRSQPKTKPEVIITSSPVRVEPKAGLLTATELNDFGKWELWKDIQADQLEKYQAVWAISPKKRYCVQLISQDNHPVIDAIVGLRTKKGEVIWQSRSDNTGKAELWAEIFNEKVTESLEIVVKANSQEFILEEPRQFNKGINQLKLPVQCHVPENIDIAFVVDATGSMTDEIDFLKTELEDIMMDVSRLLPDENIHLGSLFYRCFGNSYVTRKEDFSTNYQKISDFISQQKASEGGDEAVEEAFHVAVNQFSWSPGAKARLLFFIMDEQPLQQESIIKKMQDCTQEAALKGIRVIPVIASAENIKNAHSMEYLMRSIALATNGTYVALTDHSGIGAKHSKPVTDEYNVEFLNNLIKRLVYQFAYVPSCETTMDASSVKDTTWTTSSPVIAHEIAEVLNKVRAKETRLILTDFTSSKDSLTMVTDSDSLAIAISGDDDLIDETPGKSLSFYPNPTTGIITVKIQGKVKEFFISDISGKLVAKYDCKNRKEVQVELSNFPTGIYLLKYLHEGAWNSGKIILSR